MWVSVASCRATDWVRSWIVSSAAASQYWHLHWRVSFWSNDQLLLIWLSSCRTRLNYCPWMMWPVDTLLTSEPVLATVSWNYNLAGGQKLCSRALHCLSLPCCPLAAALFPLTGQLWVQSIRSTMKGWENSGELRWLTCQFLLKKLPCRQGSVFLWNKFFSLYTIKYAYWNIFIYLFIYSISLPRVCVQTVRNWFPLGPCIHYK